MPKDNRTIISTVRMPGRWEGARVLSEPRTFGPGQEDELAELLTPAQGKYLQEQGVIAGDWQFGGDANPGTGPGTITGNGPSANTTTNTSAKHRRAD